MTQVDFYILGGTSDRDRLHFVARIAEKALHRDMHVFINAHSDEEAGQLDELLWTFSQGSFVPHRVLRSGDETGHPEPVLIGAGIEPAHTPCQLLVNLTADVPGFFTRYERVAEVVDAEAGRRESGRERFRYYRDRGYTLSTHDIDA